MKATFKLIAGCLILVTLVSFALMEADNKAETDAVKELVLNAYVNGAFNKLDAESMEKGFHEDFAIFSAKGEEISKYPIDSWVAGVKKRRDNGYDASAEKNIWKHKFASVDVTGGAAQVKVELHNQGNHVYTDYLSLLKFESGWRIVAKVYHKH